MIEVVRFAEYVPNGILISQNGHRTGRLFRAFHPRRVKVDHGLVAAGARGQAGRGIITAVQGKVHRLRRAAAIFPRLSVPEGQQNVAVGRHIDPGLPKRIRPTDAVRGKGFCARRDEHPLRALAVMGKACQSFRAEIPLIVRPLPGKYRDQGNTQLLRRVGAQEIGALRERAQHQEWRVGTKLSKLFQLRLYRRRKRRAVLLPDRPMPGDPDDDRDRLLCVHQP